MRPIDYLQKMQEGGSVGLKPIPEDNKGLAKLPQKVRNKMGYMQEGGIVFETAMADNTAHSAIDNLIAENEINQMPRTPFSFLDRDRIDRESQELMDIAMSAAMPMMGATKVRQFSPYTRQMLSKLRQDKKFADKSIKKATELQDRNPRGAKRVKDIYGEANLFNKFIKKALIEYNRFGAVKPSTEINLKNISKNLRPDYLYQDRKNFPYFYQGTKNFGKP